ncbi:hypothetical protein V8U11_08255 [Pseudomonas chlororaphis]|uniref:hypothetical protein n=1 Tax=Pseudomonas chlororaphis TaxID=587753 RepID=UPI0030D43CF3
MELIKGNACSAPPPEFGPGGRKELMVVLPELPDREPDLGSDFPLKVRSEIVAPFQALSGSHGGIDDAGCSKGGLNKFSMSIKKVLINPTWSRSLEPASRCEINRLLEIATVVANIG